VKLGVIGDIHGHLREMVLMIRALEEHGIDRCVLLGDLCDRGPQSLGCLRYGMTEGFLDRRGRYKPLEVVRGNHEDGYVRAWRGVTKPGRVGVAEPEESRLYSRIPKSTLGWMERLPIFIRVPELNLVCVHGGVTPRYVSLEEGGEFMLRVRFLTDDGRMARGLMGNLFWADAYDGRFGTIVFGHESHARPSRYEHAVAIDGEGYRKVHAAVFSDENEGPIAFSCHYGGIPFEAPLDCDPYRYHAPSTQQVVR